MFPRTLPGRIMCFFLCIWGVFITSLTVVALTNFVTLSQAELKALKLYDKLVDKTDMKYHAGKAVYYYCRLVLYMKKQDKQSEERGIYTLKQLMDHLGQFKKCRESVQSTNEGLLNKSDLVSMIENLHKSTKKIKENQEKIVKFNQKNSQVITDYFKQ